MLCEAVGVSVVGESIVLAGAGVVAGAVGSAGGVTSLISYPALLAVGISPLPANVANLVASVVCWPGSALTSKRELSGAGRWLRRGLPVAALGAAAGAALLLYTPSTAFVHVVPFLVALGSLALLLQPWLTRWLAHNERPKLLAGPLIGLVSVYGGYFGAGSGIMLLALLLILVDQRFPQANALKNMLVGACAVVPAAIFGLFGPVEWTAVAPLATGLFLGSLAGPVIARRVPAAPVRWIVGLLGLALAAELLRRSLLA